MLPGAATRLEGLRREGRGPAAAGQSIETCNTQVLGTRRRRTPPPQGSPIIEFQELSGRASWGSSWTTEVWVSEALTLLTGRRRANRPHPQATSLPFVFSPVHGSARPGPECRQRWRGPARP